MISALAEENVKAVQVADEQLLVQLTLQIQDLLRERALGDKQFFRGHREIERLG